VPNVTAACPVSAATAASGDPLAKLSASQILMKAAADAQAEPTVCVSTPAVFQGGQLMDPATVVLVSVKDGRCEGTVTTPDGGIATVVKVGPATWVWANQAYARFLALYSKAQTSETVSARTGRWVPAGKLNRVTGDLTETCSLPQSFFEEIAATSSSPASQVTRIAGFTSIDGRPTVGISDPLGDVIYVSDTASPLPSEDKTSDDPTVTMDYFDYGIPATITAPPTDDVADGN
jgi:hypothetical protein